MPFDPAYFSLPLLMLPLLSCCVTNPRLWCAELDQVTVYTYQRYRAGKALETNIVLCRRVRNTYSSGHLSLREQSSLERPSTWRLWKRSYCRTAEGWGMIILRGKSVGMDQRHILTAGIGMSSCASPYILSCQFLYTIVDFLFLFSTRPSPTNGQKKTCPTGRCFQCLGFKSKHCIQYGCFHRRPVTWRNGWGKSIPTAAKFAKVGSTDQKERASI